MYTPAYAVYDKTRQGANSQNLTQELGILGSNSSRPPQTGPISSRDVNTDRQGAISAG
jgi:hypothetical protein